MSYLILTSTSGKIEGKTLEMQWGLYFHELYLRIFGFCDSHTEAVLENHTLWYKISEFLLRGRTLIPVYFNWKSGIYAANNIKHWILESVIDR